MLIDAFWFNNTQTEDEILQPDFFVPRTQLGLYAEGNFTSFPIEVKVEALAGGQTLLSQILFLEKEDLVGGSIDYKICTDTQATPPDRIRVSIKSGALSGSADIPCEYATLSGKMTDFDGNPFPAALTMSRRSFEGGETGLGVWSDLDGNYEVIVPKGLYNSFFIDDNSYAKTSLEGWGWHMVVDGDEVHDFKIGNGEVYSLSVWTNNGGSPTLFAYFRPMALPLVASPGQYATEINGKTFDVTDICPDLMLEDVTATLNGFALQKLSLQKVYETGDGTAMPAYILQLMRSPESAEYSAAGKQTLVVEYDMKGKDGLVAQGQGRVQFFYKDGNGLSLR